MAYGDQGGLPGWWVGEADGRKETAVVTKKEWMRNFVEAGFTDKTLVFDDYPAPYDTTCTFIASAGPATGDLSKPASELLIASGPAWPFTSVHTNLKRFPATLS